MSFPGPHEFRCVIRSFEEPIAGSITDSEGRSAHFQGWIEFAAALSRLEAEWQVPGQTTPKEEERDE